MFYFNITATQQPEDVQAALPRQNGPLPESLKTSTPELNHYVIVACYIRSTAMCTYFKARDKIMRHFLNQHATLLLMFILYRSLQHDDAAFFEKEGKA